MKKVKENKTYQSIVDFNHDFFVKPSEKSTKVIEKAEDEDYGKILAVELLDELKGNIK